MITRNKKVTDALKKATVLFVSIPFLAITAMAAAPKRRAKTTGKRIMKTGKRISKPEQGTKSPGKRLNQPKVEQKKLDIRALPGKRIEKKGAHFVPKSKSNNSDSPVAAALVRKVQ